MNISRRKKGIDRIPQKTKKGFLSAEVYFSHTLTRTFQCFKQYTDENVQS